MTTGERPSRRRILMLGGATAATVAATGCVDDTGTDDDDVTDGDSETSDGDSTDDDDITDNGDNITDDDDDIIDDDDDSEAIEDERFEIDPGTTIELDGQTTGWVGIAPSVIEDIENPTLVLEDGERYEIGWSEGDGQGHNITIWDEDDETVDDLSTELVFDPDDDQWLEFTADKEMAYYICDPHRSSMRGEMQIE